MKAGLAAAIVALAAGAAGCAPRVRVDAPRLGPVETIATVTFVGNRWIGPPTAIGADVAVEPDPTMAGGAEVFVDGAPAFISALARAERFHILPAERVLGAPSYAAFPDELTGSNAGGAQLAAGWRFVKPGDREPIAKLLADLHADAALLTYWHFSLDLANQSVAGVSTANARAHLRAWLVDKDGRIIADDEIEATGDDDVVLHDDRYVSDAVVPLYLQPIERCATKLIIDLSNARQKARGG